MVTDRTVNRQRWRRVGAVTAMALCTGAGVLSYAWLSPTSRPAAAATLPRFDGCESLRSWYAEAALRRVTAWGLGQPPVFDDVVMFAAAEVRSDIAAVGNGDTGTNLQEADVDESDVAKTDGERVVSVAGGDLVITDVTGDAPVEQGRMTLPPRLRSGELLLEGDTAVVVGWTHLRPGDPARLSWSPAPVQPARTLVARVDLSDPAAPELTRLDRIEG